MEVNQPEGASGFSCACSMIDGILGAFGGVTIKLLSEHLVMDWIAVNEHTKYDMYMYIYV